MHKLHKELYGDLQELRTEVDVMVQTANSWYKIYGKLNDKFKEVGDLYNWSKVIEDDLIKLVEKKKSKSVEPPKC